MAEAQVKSTPSALTPRIEVPGKVTMETDHLYSERETPATAPTSKTGKSVTKTPARASKTSEISPVQFNKEVFSVLRELNENYKQQNARIEQQNSKIESLSRKLDNFCEKSGESDRYDYEDSENYYEDNFVDVTDEQGDTEQVFEPASKKQKSEEGSIFKSLSDEFQNTESVDPSIKHEDLSAFINNAFRNGISDEKQSDLFKYIHRPSNTESLQKTRVNQCIWRLLKAQTQTEDSKMQTIQNLMIKASICLTKLLDKHAESFDSDDIKLATNSLALLGQSNKLINTRRKETHKGDLDPKYHYLCSASLPFTEFLYGNDVDVNKNVREINDLNRLSRNQSKGNVRAYGRGRGRSFRRPFRGRSMGRVFGKFESFSGQPSTSKNQKQGHKK